MSAISGELRNFPQANGPDVRLSVSGDEFYARYANEDGYSVVYDTNLGLYCYARLSGGRFASTGIVVAEPVPAGIRRHIREDVEVRGQKFMLRKGLQSPPRAPFSSSPHELTLGTDNGLLPGPKIHRGQVRGLTILVEFQDVRLESTVDEIAALFNQEGGPVNGNSGSVRDYFMLMSGGQLDYSNEVLGPIRLKDNKTDYITGQENRLVKEVLAEVKKSGLNLTMFDQNKDGFVDAITILYPGETLYQGWLWPHNHFLRMDLGDVESLFYVVCSIGNATIGTVCHETGHMLCRFPDLYDYGGRDGDSEDSSGLGSYCLMSYGNHTNGGRTPAPVNAYLRYLAGWAKETPISQPGVYEAVQGDYGTVFKYSIQGMDSEYFLVENRYAVAQDEHLCSSGLAVYHCDVNGSNEWEEGQPHRHYQCALLQADGRNDLERNANGGDPLDLFNEVQGEALSCLTNPSTRLWNCWDSGLVIADVGPAGPRVTFKVDIR